MATVQPSVRIDAELKRSLEEEAKRERHSASSLAVEAIEALPHGRAAVEEADRGAFISRDAMDEWVSSWDGDPDTPPEPERRPRQNGDRELTGGNW